MCDASTRAGGVELKQHEQDWNELAELDPYWAILTASGKRFGRWDSDEFFATGPPEVDGLMNRAAQLGHPQQRRRALDFGCGLGRVTRALADHFEECVGVDISEGMVKGARELNENVGGVSFLVNRAADLSVFADGSFDFVYSNIVLQHVPDRRAIGSYIAEFCRVLRPGGLLIFQLPSHIPAIFRLQWRRRLYLGLRRLGFGAPFLYRRLHLLPIAMSYVPEDDIKQLLQSGPGRLLEVETHNASGLLNAGLKSSTYYVTR
jgi:ubiquinone/menaquinone biosynthesis C-methylase UbiE